MLKNKHRWSTTTKSSNKKQNDANIITAPKEKATTRTQISERRLGAAKRGQLNYNKNEDQKVLEQDGEDKYSCPEC